MTSPPVENASGCEGCSQPHQTPPSGGVAPEAIGRSRRGSGQGWVIFTGGPPEAHLAALAHVLPQGYDRVTVHHDGSIEYAKGLDDWEPPSPINGYERDAANPLLFRPLWKSCRWRRFSVRVTDNCQCLNVVAKCGHPMSPNVDEFVKCEICNRCECREEIKPRPIPQKKTLHSRSS